MPFDTHPACDCGGIGLHRGDCSIWNLTNRERHLVWETDIKRPGYIQTPPRKDPNGCCREDMQ